MRRWSGGTCVSHQAGQGGTPKGRGTTLGFEGGRPDRMEKRWERVRRVQGDQLGGPGGFSLTKMATGIKGLATAMRPSARLLSLDAKCCYAWSLVGHGA